MKEFKPQKLKISVSDDAAALLPISRENVESAILVILKQHEAMVSRNGPQVRKRSPETTVTLASLDQGSAVCVKEFHWRGLIHAAKSWFRPSHGKRTFLNGRRLAEKGIDVARPLALVQKTCWGLPQTEWVAMEVIPRALELDRYLLKKKDEGISLERKRNLVRRFGEFIGILHHKGIYHSDLKACNILVAETVDDQASGESPPRHVLQPEGTRRALRIVPIDYDDVRFSASVSQRLRIKNLVQLFLSTPLFITLSDRARFLRAYGAVLGVSSAERRRISRKVLRQTWGKHILYVSPTGDVVENWTPVRAARKG